VHKRNNLFWRRNESNTGTQDEPLFTMRDFYRSADARTRKVVNYAWDR